MQGILDFLTLCHVGRIATNDARRKPAVTPPTRTPVCRTQGIRGKRRSGKSRLGNVRIAFMVPPHAWTNPATTEKTAAEEVIPPAPPGLRQDLMVLMKVRLNFFVLVTTFFGFLIHSRGVDMDWMKLLHTILGTAAVAFGSAAFNQLMEVDLDARMKRTADRPLPSRRMDPLVAFGIGWILSAIGIIHLAVQVGNLAAYLTAATVAIYVFIYTPLKRVSSVNTLVGAIPGAIPPVIGWVGAGGALGWEAAFLFAILFFWQLPHFIAINWLHREEYESVGYKMWSNGDLTGRKSGILSTCCSRSCSPRFP